MKSILLAISFLLVAVFTSAQIVTNQNHDSYIEVIGQGEIEVIPDQIFISFSLKERFEGKKKIELEDQEKELKKRLSKIEFDLNDLSLADANSDFIIIKRKLKDVIATKEYIMKIKGTNNIARIFEILDEMNAFNSYIQKVDHSEIKNLRKEARILAMRDAKEKAIYMLQSIDEAIGKPIYIIERENYNEYIPVMRNQKMMMSAIAEDAGSESENHELTFKKLKLQYLVNARFAIK